MHAARHARALLPCDGIHDFATRSFNTCGRCAGDEAEFAAVTRRSDLSGRQVGQGLPQDLAAFHDLECTNKQSSTDIAIGNDGNIKVHFRVRSVGRIFAEVLADAG